MKVYCTYIPSKECWSIKSLEKPNKGKSIGYRTHVVLLNAKFKIDHGKREEFLRSRKKPSNHWGIEGDLVSSDTLSACKVLEGPVVCLEYLPHSYPELVTKHNHIPVRIPVGILLNRKSIYMYT